jgi:LacI family transcriptional regulator
LSVIGFDDIPMAALTQPTLTPIRQPVTAKGEVAAQLLLDWIGGAIPVPQPMTLETELVIRQSASQPMVSPVIC